MTELELTIDELRQELGQRHTRITRLETVLKFYADKENYKNDWEVTPHKRKLIPSPVELDNGEKAREVLR